MSELSEVVVKDKRGRSLPTPLTSYLYDTLVSKFTVTRAPQKLSVFSIAMSSNTRPIVFMDINIGETPAGRMKMELFSDIVPK